MHYHSEKQTSEKKIFETVKIKKLNKNILQQCRTRDMFICDFVNRIHFHNVF